MKLKTLVISIFSIAIVYTGCWFYAADNLKKNLNNLVYNKNSKDLSVENLQIKGFPFNLEAVIEKLSFKYQLKNNFVDLDFNFSSNDVSVKTNLLFNKINLIFPQNSLVFLNLNGKVSNLNIISNKKNYIEISDNSFVNTPEVIYNLIFLNKLSMDDFKIKAISYKAEDLVFINKDKNREVFHISSKLHGLINYKSKSNNELELKAYHLFKVIDEEYLGYNFKLLSNKVDISTTLKSVQDVFVIKAAKFNIIDFQIDNFIVNLSGVFEDSSKANIDLELKLSQYKEFLNNLVKHSMLSQDKVEILQNLIQLASGDKNSENAVIKIYNSKDNELRVGYTDMNGVNDSLQQLIMSK